MELNIVYPKPRQIVQRDNNNSSRMPVVADGVPAGATVEARLIPVTPGQGTATDWQPLATTLAGGRVRGVVAGTGGWYRLELRATTSGTVATTAIEPVGIGEVFLIFGLSLAQGGHYPPELGAKDDRVSCVDYYESFLDDFKIPFAFSQLHDKAKIGPYHKCAFAWGYFGDLMAARLNVPIMLYGCAFGGTNINMNYKAIRHIPFEHGFCRYRIGMPYRPVRAAMRHFVPYSGIRGILSHHGGNDAGLDGDQFYREYKFVIEFTRHENDMPRLAWSLSYDENIPEERHPHIQANQLKILQTVPDTFFGFDMRRAAPDALSRPDNIHFGHEGTPRYAEEWARNLTDDFFRMTVPYLPNPGIDLAMVVEPIKTGA